MWLLIVKVFMVPFYLIVGGVLLALLLNGMVRMLSRGTWGALKRVF